MKPFPIRWGEPRFVCDVHLAKTAKYLRLLGFDTYWRRNMGDDEIVGMCRFGRIGLTCDRALQARMPDGIILFQNDQADRNVALLIRRYDLGRFARPFRRTLCCNRMPAPCRKTDCIAQIPERTYRWLSGFWRCPKCGKIYWRGTHQKRMKEKVIVLLEI